MHQVVRRIDAVQGQVETRSVEEVRRDDVGRWTGLMPKSVRTSDQAANAEPVCFQRRQKPSANVAGRTGQENERAAIRHRGMPSPTA